jgi:hypothetical protein
LAPAKFVAAVDQVLAAEDAERKDIDDVIGSIDRKGRRYLPIGYTRWSGSAARSHHARG